MHAPRAQGKCGSREDGTPPAAWGRGYSNLMCVFPRVTAVVSWGPPLCLWDGVRPSQRAPRIQLPSIQLSLCSFLILANVPGSHTSVSRFYLVCGSQLSSGVSSDVAVMGFYAASFSLFLDVRTSDSNHGCVFQKAWRQAFEREMGK